MLTLGNIDITAAEAFWAVRVAKVKAGDEKTQDVLLEAVRKYLPAVGLKWMTETDEEYAIGRSADWIQFNMVTNVVKDAPAPHPPSADTPIAPAVIKYDEATGDQLNTQLDFPKVAAVAAIGATKTRRRTNAMAGLVPRVGRPLTYIC